MLAAKPGRALSHRQILGQIWGPAHLDDIQYLRVLIGQFRAKLKETPDQSVIENLAGVGYRWRS